MNFGNERGLIAHNEFLLNSIWQRNPHSGKSCENVLLSETVLYKYI